ncbi:MAG: ABC transporter [Candidatus Brennerbacteria bacterium CG11_big_fil_rev_8_21_14_0_20_43_10]|uniref:ABC transporter n=2 Tax=Candidatus Brenneribacteriota TaxID=1817902 RepID=A0A2H0PUU6_9BACT|nr:MAG: ABC transporter [Candidatus Brennerbacteria bacterium CG23_combo_of_CG06-09_8_20_14_all_44_41]PIR25768.1 MAG: ABC transporter [Candidatus Brennerbacteria bacterium CG11_big_fil_rev_8_21_14_0_20_43_10]
MVEINGLTKSFPTKEGTRNVLDNVSFRANTGGFVSVIGPSGCGKSTLLHIIAGIDKADSGEIKINDTTNFPRLGHVGYMQQKDLLLPWRTVLDNIILGLELRGVARSEARQKALEHIETFGLKGFENQYPFVLSGGMRQRASFLRSVLLHQEVMLLDEPFGALDALTRHQMQEWLVNLWRKLGNTIILVTHDTDEALLLSDKIYVLSARPAKIVMSLDVDLPRPRTHATVTEPKFAKLKAKLLAQLHEK